MLIADSYGVAESLLEGEDMRSAEEGRKRRW